MLRRARLPRLLLVGQRSAGTDATVHAAPPTLNSHDQLLSLANVEYIDELERAYAANPGSVDPQWVPILKRLRDPSVPPTAPLIEAIPRPPGRSLDPLLSEHDRLNNMRLAWMIRAYEWHGHTIANLDPLKMYSPKGYYDPLGTTHAEALSYEAFGFSDHHLDGVYFINFGANVGAVFTSGAQAMTLRDIVKRLQQVYCGTVGAEFMHSGYGELRPWMRQQLLQRINTPPTKEQRSRIFADTVAACGFESLLGVKYATKKRFGLDGGESLIPGMTALLDEIAEGGATTCVMGMAHRGRLNVLANVCGKAMEVIFNEFEDRVQKGMMRGTGDVKYHLGSDRRVTTISGKPMHITLMPNPSHLEAVNPLVAGRCLARQLLGKGTSARTAVPVVIHGDASVAGQGIVYETLAMSAIENFNVGGTIHVVINNQVGFTTDSRDQRSTTYCTDLTKGSNFPVLHVNGDDPEAVADCMRIAARFRKKFARDIFVDIICYRRKGHNETDVPEWTQPLMYQRIHNHPRLVQLYADRLVADGVLTKTEAVLIQQTHDNELRQKHDSALADDVYVSKDSIVEPPTYTNWLEMRSLHNTGIHKQQLLRLNTCLTTVPADFTLHPTRVAPVIKQRASASVGAKCVDWCHAEALAFAALAMEGIHVRLTGQDVERGTFTQRHAVLTDYKTGGKYCPLAHLDPTQAPVVVSNSPLSEYGVLGFETGYSLENPKTLIMWEAQFGDFANCAQVVFDQFLSSMGSKWFIKNCGLVVSLPHGFDGMGPEHSSARLERFLQLSDDPRRPTEVHSDDAPTHPYQQNEYRISQCNWQVGYPSTPANYFHMLRRQVHRNFRVPLISLFSKGRVRTPNLSSLADMGDGTRYIPVLPSAALYPPPDRVRKVIVCSGQVEAALASFVAQRRHTTGDYSLHRDIAVLLLEQLAPFPWDYVSPMVQRFVECKEWVWLQEEPQNMGAWAFVRPRLEWALRESACKRLTYVGRHAAASPAVGLLETHKSEEVDILTAALA